MKLINQVKKNILHGHYFGRGDTVIVGTSGGPDSTALTCILHKLQYDIGFHLHMAHFNHQLHQRAGKDQKFVERLAQELNIPCSVKFWKSPHKPKRVSLEDAARRHRFKFFHQLANRINARAVVLAHTKNDLAETVLMRILRGAGLQGLRGILPSREINGTHYIRPLLNISKKDILAFLKKRNIIFRVDPTNKQTKFFRNKVRLKLLPLLEKEYNQNITELLTNLASNMTTDFSYLDAQARKIYSQLVQYSSNKKKVSFDLNPFRKQHSAIQRMVIRLGVECLQGNKNRLTLDHLREIEDLVTSRPNGSIVHLPRNIYAKKNNRLLILAHN